MFIMSSDTKINKKKYVEDKVFPSSWYAFLVKPANSFFFARYNLDIWALYLARSVKDNNKIPTDVP